MKASLLLYRMVTSHTQDKHCNASGACVLKVNNLGLYTINEKQREVTTVISGTLALSRAEIMFWMGMRLD